MLRIRRRFVVLVSPCFSFGLHEPRSCRCISHSHKPTSSIGLNVPDASPLQSLPTKPSSQISTQLALKYCLPLTSFAKCKPNPQAHPRSLSPRTCKLSSQLIHLKCSPRFRASSSPSFNPY